MSGDFLNSEMETMAPENLRLMQQQKLMRQLDYVFANSAFYRQKFSERGIDRDQVQNLEDLVKLPFTEKDELRQSQEEAPPLGRHAVAPLDEVIRIHSSSGTTGIPTFIGITRRDHQVWTDITARSLFTQGLRRGDIVVHAAGLTFFVGGLPVKDAIENIGAAFVPIGTGASDRVVLTTRWLKATALHCTPSYALYLAEFIHKKFQMHPSELGFQKLVVGAEPGGGVPAIRRRIEEEFGAPVREGLGNSDAAPIIFGECEHQQGMHFCAQEYIFCELIDPVTGNSIPMSDGAEGELVYTLIDRQCCPLIRFRTRDRVTVWTSPCRCGRSSFRVRCSGRTDDMLIVRGVNVFPSAVKDVIARFAPRTTGEMVVLLEQPGPNVVPPLRVRAEFAQGTENLEGLKKELEREIREQLIFRASVELVPEGTLPRYEMKAKLVKKLYEEDES